MGEHRRKATTNQRHRRVRSPLRVLARRALAVVVAIGLLWPPHMVMAQGAPSGSPRGQACDAPAAGRRCSIPPTR